MKLFEHDEQCKRVTKKEKGKHISKGCFCKKVEDKHKPRYKKIMLGGEWGVTDLDCPQRWMPARDEDAWKIPESYEDYAQELADLYNSDEYEYVEMCFWHKTPLRPEKPEPLYVGDYKVAYIGDSGNTVVIDKPANFIVGEIKELIPWLEKAREYLDFYGPY